MRVERYIFFLIAAWLFASCASEPEPVVTEDTRNLVSLGNPYVYYDTIEEAVKAAGFEMSVPESFGKYIDRHIATIADDMIEVTYYDEAGNEGFSIRKTAAFQRRSADGHSRCPHWDRPYPFR